MTCVLCVVLSKISLSCDVATKVATVALES